MHINIKNICMISVIVVSMNADYSIAEPKTWARDEVGRVLVYRRSRFSKDLAAKLAMGTLVGFGILSVGRTIDNLELTRCGGLLFIPSAYYLTGWYYDFNLLYKPLIVIDKHGMTYEGHPRILWKNICGYRLVKNVCHLFGNDTCPFHYIEISTDLVRLEISEFRLSIELQKLYELVDEAYKAYQELEKENAAVAMV